MPNTERPKPTVQSPTGERQGALIKKNADDIYSQIMQGHEHLKRYLKENKIPKRLQNESTMEERGERALIALNMMSGLTRLALEHRRLMDHYNTGEILTAGEKMPEDSAGLAHDFWERMLERGNEAFGEDSMKVGLEALSQSKDTAGFIKTDSKL